MRRAGIVAAAGLGLLLLGPRRAAAAEAGAGSFCCWAADDLLDVCGTCLPLAVAPPTSYCSKSKAACGSCGAATWCETQASTSEQAPTGTELLLTFDDTEAPGEGDSLTVKVGGKDYKVKVVESGFQAYPTSAPTPAPVLPTPAPPAPTQAVVQGSLEPNVEAVAQHGRLRVVGNTIVGEHGMPVRLRGMSMFWSQWKGQYWNPDTIRWLKSDWHVSFIRAAMGVEHGGYLENPDKEKAKLQAVVDACIEEGIYVVIDWHDYHAEQHVEQAKAFFSEMAQKYGDKPNVLFETYNEPKKIDWSGTIKPYHEQIVPVIRKHSDNIIIMGSRSWSTEVDVASKDPVAGENLAYTIHFYAAASDSHNADLRSKVSAALSNGVPIFATEWGTCATSGDGRLDLGQSQKWLDFFEENHISDSNWGVSDKAEACSALHGGASSSGGWGEGDLTESGAFVRSSIREYNSNEPIASGTTTKSSVQGFQTHPTSAPTPVPFLPTPAPPAPTQAVVQGNLEPNAAAVEPNVEYNSNAPLASVATRPVPPTPAPAYAASRGFMRQDALMRKHSARSPLRVVRDRPGWPAAAAVAVLLAALAAATACAAWRRSSAVRERLLADEERPVGAIACSEAASSLLEQ